MKSLSTIIRLHRWELDERRRALAELQALFDKLASEIVRLEEDLKRERAIAEQTVGASIALAAYLKAMLTRRSHLQESQRQIERQIAVARDEISNAFAELKRFELAKAERDRQDAQRRNKQEVARYDEIALDGFRRRRALEPVV